MKNRRDRQNFMYLGKDRFFYQGLMGGTVKPRSLGAFCIYVAPNSHFKIKIANGNAEGQSNDHWENRIIAAVAPNVRHQISSHCGKIISIGIEPERVKTQSMRDIQNETTLDNSRSAPIVKRLDTLQRRSAESDWADELLAGNFDEIIFGRSLGQKRIDPRIEAVLSLFDGDLNDIGLCARDCAEEVRLSTSRFLHLFKESTGVPFRRFRMWKRARNFLAHANLDSSLTNVALDLGYPDSSHFSHSIRKTYGLKPRSIRDGSRNLRVLAGCDYASLIQKSSWSGRAV